MGTGCNDTKKSVKLTKKAKKLGADGCLVVVPYYNRPTQDGCVEHFRKIAKVGLPVIVYHHPGRTGVILQPETFARLERIPNIVAIKEASNSLQTVEEIQKVCSLPILSGDDGLTVDIMQKGGVGVISVVANVIPNEWKQIVDLCQKKSFDEARKMQEKFLGVIQSMFLETNPQCVKFALHCMGRCGPKMRLPLLEPSVGSKEKIRGALKEAKLVAE
jgi:4-hydroxy-tetrahydrodipicolinate synthase